MNITLLTIIFFYQKCEMLASSGNKKNIFLVFLAC